MGMGTLVMDMSESQMVFHSLSCYRRDSCRMNDIFTFDYYCSMLHWRLASLSFQYFLVHKLPSTR